MPVTATTLEELVREVYLGDTTLTGFMERPASSYVNGVAGGGWAVGDYGWLFPQVGVSPGAETQTPFIINKFRGLSGRYVHHTGWSSYIYDDVEMGYHRIDAVIEILRQKFIKEFYMPETIPGYPSYRRAIFEYAKSNEVDPEWNLNFGFVRISTHAI